MRADLLERHTVLRVLAYLVTIIAAMVAGGMIWGVVAHYQDIILMLFLAWMIAFILQPLVSLVERWGPSRLMAVALIYCALFVLAVASIVLALPLMQSQITHAASALTALVSPGNVSSLADRAASFLQSLGFTAQAAHTIVTQLTGMLPTSTSGFSSQAVKAAEGFFGTAMTLLVDAVVVAVLSFYITLDGDRLFEQLVKRLPEKWIPDVRLFQGHVDTIFGGFIRAGLIIALVYAGLNWVILAGLGQPGALLFALLAGALLVVPFIGAFLAILPPALIVLLDTPSSVVLRNLVILVVALIIAQQITMQVVAPRVMSAHVGLHPVWFFVALLVGAHEAGVWGALFAGPVAAVVVAMLDTFFERWQRASSLYPSYPPEAPTPPSDRGGEGAGGLRASAEGAREPEREQAEAGATLVSAPTGRE